MGWHTHGTWGAAPWHGLMASSTTVQHLFYYMCQRGTVQPRCVTSSLCPWGHQGSCSEQVPAPASVPAVCPPRCRCALCPTHSPSAAARSCPGTAQGEGWGGLFWRGWGVVGSLPPTLTCLATCSVSSWMRLGSGGVLPGTEGGSNWGGGDGGFHLRKERARERCVFCAV